MKKIICLLLALLLMLGLTACGGGRYKVVKSLAEQEYSIVLRNGDMTYHYINAALRELSSEGTIDNLVFRWFGNGSGISFPKGRNEIAKLGYIEPRTFTIGADLNSYPLCYKDGNSYTGFDVELAQAVCNKLGWTLKVHPIVSADAYIELNSGNIDCAWGGIVVDPTSKDYTVLETYMSDELVIAGKGNGKSTVLGGSLYIGTDKVYMELLETNPSVMNRAGQITRMAGTPTDFFALLDSGDCDFIIVTKSAVQFNNR